MSNERAIPGGSSGRRYVLAGAVLLAALALSLAGQDGQGFAALHTAARPLIADPTGPAGTILMALTLGTVGSFFSWPRRPTAGPRHP